MFHSIKKTPVSILTLLQQILYLANEKQTLTFYPIISILSAKGYGLLLTLLSLPFCSPIQIPGFSIPFGAILSFIGLQMLLLKDIWWPKFILNKKIKSSYVITLVNLMIRVLNFFQKIMHPRWLIFTQNPFFKCFNGLVVLLCAIFLSMPFPIPFTNMIGAIPIFCIGIGLLEDDGLIVFCGYLSALIGLGSFFTLFSFGINQIKNLFI